MELSIIPESAPFNHEQRAWLNGFFSGYLGLQNNPAAAPDSVNEEEDFPWHDDTMPLEERMNLAQDRPLQYKLMAAMGQQDCGQCGYLCKTYAQAIEGGTESDLNLCVPGGRPTSKELKNLMANVEVVAVENNATAVSINDTLPVYDRKNPFLARIKKVTALNSADSVKDTRHVEIDLAGSGIAYQPGDALGIYPMNPPALVESLIRQLQANAAMQIVFDNHIHSLFDLLAHYVDITKPSDEAIYYLSSCAKDANEQKALRKLADDGIEEGCDLLELLEEFASIDADPTRLVFYLGRLQPRLYSISSTLSVHTDEVHATVGVVEYERRKRKRVGVASTYLSHRLKEGDAVRVYIQPAHEFRLPENPNAPVIMVGPGTGIAPFRSFLHERKVRKDAGENWLFFGNPTEKNDFLYRQELLDFLDCGSLSRLETAFSRDQENKIYVQHRMLACAEELWQWLSSGAYFYVCGDAQRMAKDVDDALCKIAQMHGGMSETEAIAYLKSLAKEKRYLRDVY